LGASALTCFASLAAGAAAAAAATFDELSNTSQDHIEGPQSGEFLLVKNIAYLVPPAAATLGARASKATLAWSGYCLYKYSMMNAMGLVGFSISKLSTIAMKSALIFLPFKYCCNSAWTSAAYKTITNRFSQFHKQYTATSQEGKKNLKIISYYQNAPYLHENPF
jgi:hypothetical protein